MANAIEQLKSGLVVGHAMLGRRGQQRGSVAQQVHDGDTVTTEATGNLGVRFLGVDAPEVSVPLPGTRLPFVDLDDARWERVLADPFSPELDPIDPPWTGNSSSTWHAGWARDGRQPRPPGRGGHQGPGGRRQPGPAAAR